MSEVIVEDPHFQGVKNVNSNGNVYFGDEYKGKKLKLIIEDVIDKEDE